jgi:hypothetical protein
MHVIRSLVLLLVLVGCRRTPEIRAEEAGVSSSVVDAKPEAQVAASEPAAPSVAVSAVAAAASSAPAAPCVPLPGAFGEQQVDLDSDGSPDAILFLGGMAEGGEYAVYLKRGPCAERVLRLVTGHIALLPGRTLGMRDLLATSICRHECCEVTKTVYKWTGTKYAQKSSWRVPPDCP